MNEAALRCVLSNLSDALVYTEKSNTDTNRKLWNQYAKNWDSKPSVTDIAMGQGDETLLHMPNNSAEVGSFVAHMAKNVGRDPAAGDLQFLGDEWSDEKSLDEALGTYLYPYLSQDQHVCEIGVGGGRVAARVAPRVAKLIGCDISEQMLERARSSLADYVSQGKVELQLLEGDLPLLPNRVFDLVYCFDALVHMDLHTTYAYLLQIKKVLKPGGRAFLHTSNILAPLGWQRFSKQKQGTAGGFCFTSPDIVRHMCTQAGFVIVSSSSSVPNPDSLSRTCPTSAPAASALTSPQQPAGGEKVFAPLDLDLNELKSVKQQGKAASMNLRANFNAQTSPTGLSPFTPSLAHPTSKPHLTGNIYFDRDFLFVIEHC